MQPQTQECSRILLYKETKRLANTTLQYCFSTQSHNGEPSFYISVEAPDEQCEVSIRSNLPGALALFRRIVRGGVLPYTLPEIAEDFAYSEKI
ncbi:MAG: hypothetical protein E7666_07250 [Ruminococcaceae bacterium]|nr:hypothetical protein [Oscillospiraceae bacterium]